MCVEQGWDDYVLQVFQGCVFIGSGWVVVVDGEDGLVCYEGGLWYEDDDVFVVVLVFVM